MKTKGTVWVLGASSGLGLATAQAFAADGWLVVAGARSFARPPEGAEEPGNHKGGTQQGSATEALGGLENVRRLPLDVTSGESCEQFVREARAISGEVDVFCYGAGILLLGPCEETTPEEYEKVMQTNFLGMTRMVQKVLPIMRKQGGGKIVLMSSLNGLIGIPFQSAYTASKHAIEGYAKCLTMEMKPFGIQVTVVEPGDHQGGSQRYRLKAQGAGASSPYRQEYESTCEAIRRDEGHGLLPEKLGQKVVTNANRKQMRYRVRVASFDQRSAIWLDTLLWPRLFLSILRKYYTKKG